MRAPCRSCTFARRFSSRSDSALPDFGCEPSHCAGGRGALDGSQHGPAIGPGPSVGAQPARVVITLDSRTAHQDGHAWLACAQRPDRGAEWPARPRCGCADHNGDQAVRPPRCSPRRTRVACCAHVDHLEPGAWSRSARMALANPCCSPVGAPTNTVPRFRPRRANRGRAGRQCAAPPRSPDARRRPSTCPSPTPRRLRARGHEQVQMYVGGINAGRHRRFDHRHAPASSLPRPSGKRVCRGLRLACGPGRLGTRPGARILLRSPGSTIQWTPSRAAGSRPVRT